MADKIFKRKIYSKMLDWKNNSNGETALLIQGARRVGKSTVALQFAENEYQNYILIDFSIAKDEVFELFDNMSDLDSFFFKLQFIYKAKLTERKSVIIFDEVQKCPKARQAIKHLVKDKRYDYIETGSLLSIRKNIKDIIIPSEETRIDMFPLDYEEFKWALGDEVTFNMMRNAFSKKLSLGDSINRSLLRDFRLYMIVGGMPQAINKYLETNNLSAVDIVKRNIINLYSEDFYKIDSTGSISRLFEAIPSQLSSNTLRYNANSILGTRSEKTEELIFEMGNSKVVNIAYHSNDPNVGSALSKNTSRYKMYLCDTGLFLTLAFKDKETTDNIIYQKLLNDKLSADLGYVYENVVAQELKASGNELFYYTFRSETSNKSYEIDFLLSREFKICPIEVKSSGYKTHASIDRFCAKFSERISHKYLVYTKDLRIENNMEYIPVYMTALL